MTVTDADSDTPDIADSILVARGLRKEYNEIPVLNHIDFSIAQGEVKAVLGGSGSGKSTMLRVLALLEPADAGVIELDGDPVGTTFTNGARRVPPERTLTVQRRDIGMVFQKFNLFPHLTAIRNVTLALMDVVGLSKREAHDHAAQALSDVGLGDHLNHYPGELSGGQQQRVAIARALVLKPQVLLFDEPTSALDPELVGEVLRVMEWLATDGMTMVVVTHETRFARRAATTVSLMHGGRLVEEAEPERFFTTPATEETRRYIEHIHH